MTVSETILFFLAKRLYRTNISLPAEAKASTINQDESSIRRSSEFDSIFSAAKRYGVELAGKTLLDFGCNDGAVTVGYLEAGASRVIGVDIDESAIQRACALHPIDGLDFLLSTPQGIPLENDAVDTVISFDVFEHVSDVEGILAELFRIIRPGGQVLFGVCGGWFHPFAPHLRAVMPVPWAHVLFSEKTVLRVCRKVYNAEWYTPQFYDLDSSGNKIKDKYSGDEISTSYLNKYLLKDFEEALKKSGFQWQMHLVPFGYKYAGLLIAIPWFREFFTGYAWFVLRKP